MNKFKILFVTDDSILDERFWWNFNLSSMYADCESSLKYCKEILLRTWESEYKKFIHNSPVWFDPEVASPFWTRPRHDDQDWIGVLICNSDQINSVKKCLVKSFEINKLDLELEILGIEKAPDFVFVNNV